MTMRNANIHEAKTHLSKLIEAVLAGEKVIISRAGKPLVELVPYEGLGQPRRPGGWEGQIEMAADFDEESAEVNGLFYGESGAQNPPTNTLSGLYLNPYVGLCTFVGLNGISLLK